MKAPSLEKPPTSISPEQAGAPSALPLVDFSRLRASLTQRCDEESACLALLEQRPYLFALSAAHLAREEEAQMRATIAAVEAVVALPAYRDAVLARSAPIVRFDPGTRGVFLGYDFHLTDGMPQLIEINTNAGGGLLNILLAHALVGGNADAASREDAFVAMFREEWRLQRGDRPLRTVAIVDDDPAGQYLYPEFLLFQALLRRHGLQAEVADAGALTYRDGVLRHGETAIDLVYNRVTDFMLEQPAHAALRHAYLDGAAVVTPHPRAHALYADKRNLAWLCDAARLRQMGAGDAAMAALVRSVPSTVEVAPGNAEALWCERRRLFFKPIHGFGGRGAYRGEKLTRRVWQDIVTGQYVAQAYVPPSERLLCDAATPVSLKVDFRHYVYAGVTQLVAARLYQGQTTNFRTPQGGFAPVLIDG
ncbi:MAG: hypothetical protein WC091_16020 [Sulfuricellaceae bacterium]